MKDIGKPCAREWHARFDGGSEENSSGLPYPSVSTRDKGHGRRETRTIQVLHVHDGLGFPGVEQAARIKRRTDRIQSTIDPKTRCRVTQSVFTREVAYVITSLYPEEAGPEELLSLARGHWSIEAMHHIEDVTFAADSSRIRTGNAPANMTLLTRLLAIGAAHSHSSKFLKELG